MDLIHPNGIDARTGRPLLAPLTAEQVAAFARAELHSAAPLTAPEPVRGLPRGLDPARLETAGWAVVFPAGADHERREHLAPLLAHREALIGTRLFKTLDVRPGERPRDWLVRHGVGPTDVDPTRVPYYLLFVADPTEISFEFQTALAVRYCTGRLALDPPGLAAYADSLVRAERSAPLRSRSVALWAPRHDPATTLSADKLAHPLHRGGGRGITETPPHELVHANGTLQLGEDATRPRLLDLLHGRSERPAVLLTASHGLALEPDDSGQLTDQGALVCQEWSGFRPPDRATEIVGAADIADDADLHGLVAFLFACFGAGTPALDGFLRDPAETPRRLAPRPFMSALPARLLSHRRGGALAVIGHVDRAWGYSMWQPGVGPQILPFYNFIARVLDGEPVGHALRDFPERSAILGASLLDDIRAGDLSPKELAQRWIERNDARNYILLGDPAARLPFVGVCS